MTNYHPKNKLQSINASSVKLEEFKYVKDKEVKPVKGKELKNNKLKRCKNNYTNWYNLHPKRIPRNPSIYER